MKILIGYDGSQYSETILEDLRRAGLLKETEAVIMTVTDVREIPTSPFLAERISSQIERLFSSTDTELRSSLDNHLKHARADALDAARQIEEMFPDWKVSAEAVSGKPAEELIKKADELQPDLLIVGSHGRSALGRILLGSVSHKVLHEAHCSVRISRQSDEKENSKIRILVCVDGSTNAEAVVETVAGRLWTENTEIRLIAVDDPFNRPEIGYIVWNQAEDKPEDNEKSREWIDKVINRPAQILKSAGLEVSHKIIWGDAANMILQEAKEWNADTIFVGARGISGLRRFLLGSVSSAVAAQAHCSVEVIR